MPDSSLYPLILTVSSRCFLTQALIQQREKYLACMELSIAHLPILRAGIQIALPP